MAQSNNVLSRRAKAQLYHDIWKLFEAPDGQLNDKDLLQMVDILRKLSHSVEMVVRQRVAERVSEREDLPPQLAVMLCNDQIEVAYPILLRSKLLRDVDLIDVVRNRSRQHQLATAMRENLPATVSDALAETGDEEVIATLINNHSAQISDALVEHLVAESERIDSYQKPLLRRPDLPRELAKRMYAWVSAALRSYIIDTFELSSAEIDDVIQASLASTIELDHGEADATAKLVETLHKDGKLNSAFILKSLRQGEVRLFEHGLARLAELPVNRIQQAIYDGDGRELATVCRACGMNRQTFRTLFEFTRHTGQQSAVVGRSNIDELNYYFDSLSPLDARLMTQQWRTNPTYRRAVSQLADTAG